jgi:hypothetical protein
MMRRLLACSALLSLILATTAIAAPVIPGDLVIYRVGDGTAPITNTSATAVFLDEYSPSGALVQSIAVPFTGTSALTAVGNATTEGVISRSQDGSTLIFTGYRKNAGGTSPAGDTYAVTPRVIGTLTVAGAPDTTTSLTNDNGSTTANTIRSATSVNGSAGSPLWVSTSSRISYDSSGLGSSAGTTQIDGRNSRQVNLADNTLYASNGSTSITSKVQSYGNLPTGATSPTAVISRTLNDAVNGFYVADISSTQAGSDTIYALSTVENLLLKYSFNGTNWIAGGSISAGGAQNITGLVSGSNVTLYATSGTSLLTLTDSSGFGGTLAGTLASLATAANNTAFRGIGLFEPAAVPEAGAFLLVGLVGLALSGGAWWRKRSS